MRRNRVNAVTFMALGSIFLCTSGTGALEDPKTMTVPPLGGKRSHNNRSRMERNSSVIQQRRFTLDARAKGSSFHYIAGMARRGGSDEATMIAVAEYQSAVIKTTLTVVAAVFFGLILIVTRGPSTGYEFFAGYLVEQSLSIDNLFVFIMLFEYFRVPLELQNRVLSWGITGAIVLRGLMIGIGVAAIQKFKVIILFFAGILIASSVKLLTESEGGHDENMSDNMVMKLARALFPNTSTEFHGEDFFIVGNHGNLIATPLLLCLVCVELSDFVFAVDSIPAVLGVSKDPLVVYASNIFAIMALRSLYTLVAKAITELRYLKPAVAMVLGFVGSKMIAEYFHVEIGTGVSLSVVSALLGWGVTASVLENKRGKTTQMPSVTIPNWTNFTLIA